MTIPPVTITPITTVQVLYKCGTLKIAGTDWTPTPEQRVLRLVRIRGVVMFWYGNDQLCFPNLEAGPANHFMDQMVADAVGGPLEFHEEALLPEYEAEHPGLSTLVRWVVSVTSRS